MSDKLFSSFSPATFDDWKKAVEKELKGKKYEEVLAVNIEKDIQLEPLYSSFRKLDGHEPVRSAYSSGYLCENEQMVDIRDCSLANKKILRLLNEGVSAVHCSGEIAGYEELSQLFSGVEIQYVLLSFSNQQNYLALAQNILLYTRKHHIDPAEINVTFYANPVGNALQCGGWNDQKSRELDNWLKLSAFVAKEMPNSRTTVIDAALFHNAGATYSQEIANAVALAVDYIDLLTNEGVTLRDAFRRLQFNFAVGTSLLPEIAKIRAFRAVWAAVENNYTGFKPGDDYEFIHVETSLLYSAHLDNYSNLLRHTTEVFAAVCANADAVFVHPYNEAVQYEADNEFAERMARNIFLLLKEEAHLDKVIDPSGGAYFIEELTQKIAEKSWELLLKTESAGGFISEMEKGNIQREIHLAFTEKYAAVTEGKKVMIGVNKYLNKMETALSVRNAERINYNEFPALIPQKLSVLVPEKTV